MKIEEKFKFFFENMEDMVFLVEWKNDSFWYVDVNRSAQQKLNVDMIGRTLEDVLPVATFDFLMEHYSSCVEKRGSVSYSDLNLFVPDMAASETTLTPIIDEDRFFVLAITKDVNELKKKEEDYLFLNSLVTNTVDSMLVVDVSGTILKINQAFQLQFGWTKEELIGQLWQDMKFSPEHLKTQTAKTFSELIKGNPVPPFETSLLTKSGQAIHTSVSYSPILDKDDNVVAISMIYQTFNT